MAEGGGEALRSKYGLLAPGRGGIYPYQCGPAQRCAARADPLSFLMTTTSWRKTQFVERAIYQGDYWSLEGIHGTRLSEQRTETYSKDNANWQTRLTPQLLSIVVLKPDHLAMAKLLEYTRYLKRQGLETADYMLSFWQKLFHAGGHRGHGPDCDFLCVRSPA